MDKVLYQELMQARGAQLSEVLSQTRGPKFQENKNLEKIRNSNLTLTKDTVDGVANHRGTTEVYVQQEMLYVLRVRKRDTSKVYVVHQSLKLLST